MIWKKNKRENVKTSIGFLKTDAGLKLSVIIFDSFLKIFQ